ncbi:MAG: hypothetical protein KC464_21380 [Myxococcales bacterium]|nr:hypothetical protein [Myxococcales bacterium]
MDEGWQALLRTLDARAAAGAACSAQRSQFTATWRRATTQAPSLLRPAVGYSSDGVLLASWSFAHLPGRVFTLDVLPDGSVEWFHQDGSEIHGSEGPVPELPDEALERLARGFGNEGPKAR